MKIVEITKDLAGRDQLNPRPYQSSSVINYKKTIVIHCHDIEFICLIDNLTPFINSSRCV